MPVVWTVSTAVSTASTAPSILSTAVATWRVATPVRVQRELALGGKGLLGDVEGAVNGAGDVDAGHWQPEGAG